MGAIAGIFSSFKNRLFPPTTGLLVDEIKSYYIRKPLSEYLLAAAYDEEIGCYLCRDNTVGFVYEAYPKPLAGEETIKTLQDIFSSVFLPQHTAIQITLWADDYLEPFARRFIDTRLDRYGNFQNEESRVWCQSVANFITEHKMKGAFPDIVPVPFRNFRLFISFKLPYDAQTYREKAPDIAVAIKNIKTSLETAYLFPELVTPEKYIHVMSLLYNPGHDKNLAPNYDENEYIYKQIVEADTETEIARTSIRYNGVYGKALTIKQFPEEVTIVDAVTFLGDVYRNELQINSPFLLTLNITLQDDKTRSSQQQKAEFLYKQKAANALSVKLTKKQEEAAWLMEKMVDGNKLIKAYLVWWMYHPDYTVISKSAQVLKSMLNMRGYKVQEEIRSMNLGLFLAATPMNLSYEIDEALIKRGRTMFDFNAAHLSPVQADWKGTGSPHVPFVSRRGQQMFFSLFDGAEGYNACVAAKTGSGKSFLIQHILASYYTLPQVSNIWVIDVGESYKTLCESLGGVFLDFREDADIVLNPFSDCRDIDEDMDLFINLIAKMAKPTEKITDTEKSVIEEAIKDAWLKHGQETNVDKVIESLRQLAEATGDLLKKQVTNLLSTNLFRWSTAGVFGKFFNGKNNIDLAHKFVVLELKHLSHREDLRNVILMVLFYHIYRVVYMDDDRSKRKLLIFDEAWQFFDDPQVAKFIERGYRTFRKHGSSAITITQGVHDFYKNESTLEMMFQSAHWLLLSQKQESINMLKNESKIALSEYEFDQLGSLKTVKGYYSEIFFITPFGRGVGRLEIPRQLYWIYTTDADDVSKRKKMVENYGLEDGIRKCIETYG